MSKIHEPAEYNPEAGVKSISVPEGANFNVESMPGQPWGLCSVDLQQVEPNMM